VRAHRERLTLGCCLLLANRAASLVLPGTSKWLIDEIIAKDRWDTLPVLTCLAAGAVLAQAITSFMLSQVIGVAAHRAILSLRRATAAHVMRLPISYFDSTKIGILVSRVINDTEGIRNIIGNNLPQCAGLIITAIFSGAILFFLNWRLAVMTHLILIALGVRMIVASKRLHPLFREAGAMKAEVTGRLVEALGGVRIVKVYGAEKHEEFVFTRGVHRLFRNVVESLTVTSGVAALSSLVIGTIGIITMWFGAASVHDNEMTAGDLVMYILFAGISASPVMQIVSLSSQLSETFAGLDRIREVSLIKTEDADEGPRQPLSYVHGDVQVEDVCFEYRPGVPVLTHISLHAPAGTTTALVGPSGSGKTTLISLIMGLYRPAHGRILIDGCDLATVPLKQYRKHLGVVLQSNFLFDGTIAANIAYSRPSATRREILWAGELSQCDEFVKLLAAGYDTVVGERGLRLSGGQCQLIAIARALLADPEILILDEATSNLDSENEVMIQMGLRGLQRDRTTFVIAHRLSTVCAADQILVLDRGTIVQRGCHQVLLRVDGRYRTLYETQYGIGVTTPFH